VAKVWLVIVSDVVLLTVWTSVIDCLYFTTATYQCTTRWHRRWTVFPSRWTASEASVIMENQIPIRPSSLKMDRLLANTVSELLELLLVQTTVQ